MAAPVRACSRLPDVPAHCACPTRVLTMRLLPRKEKLPGQQNGQVYLTSHRIAYVDKHEPRTHSVALDLRDVDRYDFSAGFLKSSAKITLVTKPPPIA